MTDSLLPSQDDLLSQTMTHAAPKPNYAANVESAISSAVGPSWLEQASAEHQRASQAFEKGGAHALLALDPTETFDLAGGFNAAGMFVPIDAEAASLATRMLKQGASKDSIWKIFGIFQGADGFWRREIHDLGARLTPEGKSGKARTVGEALEHPELFQENPELANIPLKYSRSDMFGGAYYPPGMSGGERIVLNRVGDTVSTGSLLHEIMHGIQERGDFAEGGSPKSMFAMAKEAFVHFGGDPNDHATIERLAYAAYRRLAGEVEANNVKERYLKMLKWVKENPGKDLSEWIKENPPESTEEYPRDQQNVVGAGKKPAVSESRSIRGGPGGFGGKSWKGSQDLADLEAFLKKRANQPSTAENWDKSLHADVGIAEWARAHGRSIKSTYNAIRNFLPQYKNPARVDPTKSIRSRAKLKLTPVDHDPF